MNGFVAAFLALALVGPSAAFAQEKTPQEGEKKAPAKEGEVQKKAPPQDGEKKPGGKVDEGFSLSVAEVDTNGDGRISGAELKAALSKFTGAAGGKTKEGVPPVKKEAPPGEKKDPSKEGEGVKKAPPKEGEKKEPTKEGGELKKAPPKEGEKKEPTKEEKK